MADCSKDEIPEEIIHDKGAFHCKGQTRYNEQEYYGCRFPDTYGVEYEPTDGDIVALGMPDLGEFTYGAYEALRTAIGPYVYLKNVAYEDEYMSWMSDPITVAHGPVNESKLNRRLTCADCACCGKSGRYSTLSVDPNYQNFYPSSPPPAKCAVTSIMDDWSFTGSSVDVSWYGATLQFVVNLYRVYCCVKNDNDEIIDYDYGYNLISMYIKDGKTYIGSQWLSNYTIAAAINGCGWCQVTQTGSAPVVYPSKRMSVSIKPLPGDIWIPVKVKEF